MPAAGSTHGRILAGVRLAWAGALLVDPAALLEAAGGRPDDDAVRVARILGARHAVQGAVELATWPRWRRSGAAVDAAHAATAAALAAADRRWRRLAGLDTVVAAAFAAAGLF